MAKDKKDSKKGEAKPSEPKRDTVSELKHYEWAMVAATMPGERKFYSIPAMGKLYSNFGMSDDPIVARALANASMGASDGNISDAGVLQAIGMYSAKFDDAYKGTTVSEFLGYVEDRGYKDLPNETKALLMKHSGKKISDLNKEDKEQKTVIAAMSLLRQQVLEGNLYSKLVTENTTRSLDSLVEKKDDKGKK